MVYFYPTLTGIEPHIEHAFFSILYRNSYNRILVYYIQKPSYVHHIG